MRYFPLVWAALWRKPLRTILGGLLPAIRAARLPVVDALRQRETPQSALPDFNHIDTFHVIQKIRMEPQ